MSEETNGGMRNADGEPIVLIEYYPSRSGWKPYFVLTTFSCYDFDWCEQDQMLAYYRSGGGDNKTYGLVRCCDALKLCGATIWYDRERITLTHDGKPITDEEGRQLGYRIIREPLGGNPFDDLNATEDTMTYCIPCGDNHPDGQMCRHVLLDEIEDRDAELSAARELLSDTRKAMKLLIGRIHKVPWLAVLDTEVDAYISVARTLAAEREKT